MKKKKWKKAKIATFPPLSVYVSVHYGSMEARIFPLASIANHPLWQACPLRRRSLSAFFSLPVKHVMDLTFLAGTACLYGTGRSVDTCEAPPRTVGAETSGRAPWLFRFALHSSPAGTLPQNCLLPFAGKHVLPSNRDPLWWSPFLAALTLPLLPALSAAAI